MITMKADEYDHMQVEIFLVPPKDYLIHPQPGFLIHCTILATEIIQVNDIGSIAILRCPTTH